LERSTNRAQLEILVADCGSHDGSAGIDTEFPAVNMLRLPHHVGAVRAMNIATRTAKADLVLYLSPAVEVEPGTVTALADRLDAEPTIVAACPGLVDPQGAPATRVYRLPDYAAMAAAANGADLVQVQPDSAQESVLVECSGLDALMIRKSFIRGMNFFDQRYGHYWAEAELAMQIRRANKKIWLYPGIRAARHSEADPVEIHTLAKSDRAVGAIAFVGKYFGSWSSIRLRVGLAAGALIRLDLGRFSAFLGGQKLDGTQAG
jgi:GT2 family glycosyltransferase